ncbi:TRAP transporter substrate-binding protein [Pseudovibrio exalbescens]|uniref:TRAP transporter substrate-binding protein n=1 Tax=Pseudovibrio exalbescens TaxID=197461 RepID=UPI002365D6C8|nr:TRAP transporter substrate-binding protein [Pseudovibrio exalbescens]MDD7909932.1 TRAP transporter substrate-binding protein [Pseudovibrio exalbescens]
MTHLYKVARAAVACAITSGAFFAAVSTASAADFTAQIGHLESTAQSRHIMLEKVAELVKERTDGAVEFQIYPQGQLGNQREMTEGVQLGIIQGTVSPAGFLGGFNPAVSVLDIPYLMPTDAEKAQKIRGGEFGEALLATFDSRGVKGVALWPNGWKHMTSNKPLESVDDFEGQKFRVMDSKILIGQFTALGASAIVLPFNEVYTSLQTGIVDGQENPLDTIQRMKFFEVQDNLVLTNHGAFEDVVLFNQAWWAALPAEYQTVITEAFEEVIPELVAHKTAAAEDALKVIKDSGTTVRELDDAKRAKMREVMYPTARDAYLSATGEEGQKLIAIYEKAFADVSAN